jgi:hypothetical protein
MSKKKRKQKNLLAEFKRDIEKNELFKGQKIQVHESGEKMSEILGLFIEPFVEYAKDYNSYNRLAATAVIAWNAALMGAKQQRQFLDATKKPLGIEAQKDFVEVIGMMIERKKRFFADNHRYILDYKVTDRGRDYHLAVVSTPQDLSPNDQPPEEKPKSSTVASIKKLLDDVFGKQK